MVESSDASSAPSAPPSRASGGESTVSRSSYTLRSGVSMLRPRAAQECEVGIQMRAPALGPCRRHRTRPSDVLGPGSSRTCPSDRAIRRLVPGAGAWPEGCSTCAPPPNHSRQCASLVGCVTCSTCAHVCEPVDQRGRRGRQTGQQRVRSVQCAVQGRSVAAAASGNTLLNSHTHAGRRPTGCGSNACPVISRVPGSHLPLFSDVQRPIAQIPFPCRTCGPLLWEEAAAQGGSVLSRGWDPLTTLRVTPSLRREGARRPAAPGPPPLSSEPPPHSPCWPPRPACVPGWARVPEAQAALVLSGRQATAQGAGGGRCVRKRAQRRIHHSC